MFGLGQPATEPLGHGQVPVGDGVQHPFTVADRGQGLRSERGCPLSVATEVGEDGALERDRRGDIRQ